MNNCYVDVNVICGHHYSLLVLWTVFVGTMMFYMSCAAHFFSVDAEDVKRIGSTINVLSSEKLKAQKASHRSLFIPIGLQHSQKVFFFN